jgi:hypothetical protein
MLAPTWRTLRIGPYLRREREKRQYHRLLTTRGYVSGVRRQWVLRTFRLVDEEDAGSAPLRRAVLRFSGIGPYFEPLRGRALEVRKELLRIARSPPVSAGHHPYIGIHVRRGDFSIPASSQVLRDGAECFQIGVDWYVAALRALRSALGDHVDARVFSDGAESELRALLTEPRVTLASNGTALDDLFALSRSATLIASGSTFSMWGSYLGGVPTVWHPGQRRQRILDRSDAKNDLEPEWTSGTFPAAFLHAAASALKTVNRSAS